MDDFSFPAIQTDQDSACNLPFPHFAASPLWFMSDDNKTAYRRSFSSAGEAARVADTLNVSATSDDEGARDRFVSTEEKMDMLWEDFNEELYRVSKGKAGSVGRGSSAELHCDQGLDVPKRTSGLLCHRRPSLVVMLKVLKKLFLIQKNGSERRASIYKI